MSFLKRLCIVSYLVIGSLYGSGSKNLQRSPSSLTEDARDKNYCFLNVYDDEVNDSIRRTNISREALTSLGWLRKNINEKVGSRENRLLVPVRLLHWKRLQSCCEVIALDDIEALRLEILDRLTIREFADLLLYATFLEFDQLLEVGGKEFVSQFKRENIEAFKERGVEYLNGSEGSVVFVPNGKPQKYKNSQGVVVEIPWAEIIATLKNKLAPYILEKKDQYCIRANLKKILPCAGEVAYFDCAHDSDLMILAGSLGDGGFCEIRDSITGQLICLISTKKQPFIGAVFATTPLITFIQPKEFSWSHVIGQGVPQLKAEVSIGEDAIKIFAQNAEKSVIAFAQDTNIHLYDNRRFKKIFELKSPGNSAAKICSLFFVPHTPVFVDIREGGVMNFWNYETGELIVQSQEHKQNVIKYACGSKFLVTASADGQVIEWFINVQRVKGRFSITVTCGEEKREFLQQIPICFNAAADKLLLANDDHGGCIADLKVESKDMIQLLDTDKIIEADFAREDLLATLSDTNRITLWNPNDGSVIIKMCMLKPTRSLKFSHDGDSLVTLHTDQTVILWYIGNVKLADYIAHKLNFDQALLFFAWQGHDLSLKDKPELLKIINSLEYEGIDDFFKA